MIANRSEVGNFTFSQLESQKYHPPETMSENVDTSPDNNDPTFKQPIRKTSSIILTKPNIQIVTNWLREHFEEHSGTNISREMVYADYCQFSTEKGLEPMNAASFGKVIRAVFPNLHTRRLGVRGQSKYHYNGIRIKPTSPLALLSEYQKSCSLTFSTKSKSIESLKSQPSLKSPSNATLDSVMEVNRPIYVPEPPVFQDSLLEPEISAERVHSFLSAYQQHMNQLCHFISQQELEPLSNEIEHFWKHNSGYWPLLQSHYLSRWICDFDVYLYSIILNALSSDMLSSIKNQQEDFFKLLSERFEGWIFHSLEPIHSDLFKHMKMQVSHAFVLSLKRSLSLNEIVQNVGQMISNDALVHQMLHDWKRLDLETVNEATCWTCQWQEAFLEAVERDIVNMLKKKASITNWSTWLSSLIQKSVSFPMLHENYDLMTVEYNAKQFLTKFSFYMVQIIRDFTIRTVTTFGSWHTLRLFFDEYIWCMVIKNLSILKINHLSRQNINPLPRWLNGVLFYYLEQHHYDQSFLNREPHPLPHTSHSVKHVGVHEWFSMTRNNSLSNLSEGKKQEQIAPLVHILNEPRSQPTFGPSH